MPKLYTYTMPLEGAVLDAFCNVQDGFTDQFVYYRKDCSRRFLGLGRCIAVPALADIDPVFQGPKTLSPILFSFNRFDATNPKPLDDLFASFPQVPFMVPELVFIETESGRFIQVNSLGPVYPGRVERFAEAASRPYQHACVSIPYQVGKDDRQIWSGQVKRALEAIKQKRLSKVVLSRRIPLHAQRRFSSKDVLVNLIDGPAKGCVFLYRYGDVFFCGCTPELLVRVCAGQVESECLAGTAPVGATDQETDNLGQQLLADEKNRREHEAVVGFIRQVLERNCYQVDIPTIPQLKQLVQVQHLQTPAHARLMEGHRLDELAAQLMPTPALSGLPVGEALMLIREIESYNRGLFGGSVGYSTADGEGEYSVTIRSGVFDGQDGWLYAGCGIVEGSNADEEYDEIDMKLKTILSAFEGGRE